MPLPHVVVAGLVHALQVVHFVSQHLRKPGVIPPADLHHYCARRRMNHKPLVRIIRLQIRVKRRPNLAAILAERRNQDLPRVLAGALRFLDPDAIVRLQRLDRVHVVPQPRKRDLGPVSTGYAGLLNRIHPAQPKRPDLVRQQLVD